MNNLVPTRQLRVRLSNTIDPRVLILQVCKVPASPGNYAYAISDERWVDATVEDLSMIAGLSLGSLERKETT